jgi:hypothetical protein
VLLAAFALAFPGAGFLIDLVGVRGVYLLTAVGCTAATLILIPAMRTLGAAGPAAGASGQYPAAVEVPRSLPS